MKQSIIIIVFLTFISGVQAASFNCSKATTLVEVAICSDAQISNLDDVMSIKYKQALNSVSDSKGLMSNQKLWLKNVRNKCKTSSCLNSAYNDRISFLSNSSSKTYYDYADETPGIAEAYHEYWQRVVSTSSQKIRTLIHDADEYNGKCRGGSGDEPDTLSACGSRDSLIDQLKELGWCWGDNSGQQIEYQKTWQQCGVLMQDVQNK